MQENNIATLNWPAQSPDLSPIENIWGIMKQKFVKLNLENRQRNTIIEAINRIWNNIPVADVRQCIRSMPRRCRSVIEGRGFPLKY